MHRENSVNFIDNDKDLSRQMEAFWQIERTGLEERLEGSNSYDILQKSTKLVDGHYQTSLLGKGDDPKLPNNRTVAESRLNALKQKF